MVQSEGVTVRLFLQGLQQVQQAETSLGLSTAAACHATLNSLILTPIPYAGSMLTNPETPGNLLALAPRNAILTELICLTASCETRAWLAS